MWAQPCRQTADDQDALQRHRRGVAVRPCSGWSGIYYVDDGDGTLKLLYRSRGRAWRHRYPTAPGLRASGAGAVDLRDRAYRTA